MVYGKVVSGESGTENHVQIVGGLRLMLEPAVRDYSASCHAVHFLRAAHSLSHKYSATEPDF